MDKELKKWQNLWKKQKAKPLEIDDLIMKLNKLERKAKFQRIIVLIGFSFSILMLASHLSAYNNIYNLLFLILVGAGMLLLIIQLYKSRYNLISSEEKSNNQNFIETHLKKLKDRMLIPTRYMLIFMILLILGFNIVFYGSLKESTILVKIFAHLSTIVLFVILYSVRKIGIKQYEKQILPLIEKLENINKQ